APSSGGSDDVEGGAGGGGVGQRGEGVGEGGVAGVQAVLGDAVPAGADRDPRHRRGRAGVVIRVTVDVERPAGGLGGVERFTVGDDGELVAVVLDDEAPAVGHVAVRDGGAGVGERGDVPAVVRPAAGTGELVVVEGDVAHVVPFRRRVPFP